MKLAVIADTANLGVLEEAKLDYHMALGQALIRDKVYAKAYAELKRAGAFIMVDNGAAEPAEERKSFAEVFEAFRQLGADEVVLPDILRDTTGTKVAWAVYRRVIQAIPVAQRVCIPQGETVEEWCACLEYAADAFDFGTLGIPKHLERFPNGRVKALKYVLQRFPQRKWAIHFFGIWSSAVMEIRALKPFKGVVRGIDTAAPIAYAQAGESIESPVHHSLQWGVAADPQLARENIAMMKSWCEEV